MRKIILSLFSISALFADAQSKKTIEISAHINSVDQILPLGNLHFVDSKIMDGGDYKNKSIAFGLTGKYFVSDNIAIYLKAIYTNRNLKDYRDLYAAIHAITDYRINQHLYKIAPGCQWSIVYHKISFLSGFDLPFTIYGKAVQKIFYFEEELNGSNQLHQNVTYNIPGGIIFGIGFWGGANYYFTKKLALGFSMGSAYQYISVGGTLVNSDEITTSANTTKVNLEHRETIRQISFSPFQASINLTWKIKNRP